VANVKSYPVHVASCIGGTIIPLAHSVADLKAYFNLPIVIQDVQFLLFTGEEI
jgi:hypothetical protein